MSNFSSSIIVLILVLFPLALSEQEAIQAIIHRLDSKTLSPSIQEAAAKALLRRLLPTHVDSFEFQIVSRVPRTPPLLFSFYGISILLSVNFLFCQVLYLNCIFREIQVA